MLAEIGKKKMSDAGEKHKGNQYTKMEPLTDLSNLPNPTFIDHDEDEFSPEAIFGIKLFT
jgi:hypothetical protein